MIPGGYTLEVSSPGFDRPVRKPADFARYSGERITVKMYLPVDGRKSLTGVLSGFDGGVVLVECDGKCHRVPIENVRNANLIR
jgi:ribosome maturation factor RimP